MKIEIKLKIIILSLLLISIFTPAHGQDFKARISEATSIETIIKDFGRFKGFGQPQWARFSNYGKEIFIIWNDPFSGRSTVFVQAFYYDDKKWILFLDDTIENTSALSVMILNHSNKLVFYSSDEKMVKECSLSKLTPLYQTKK